MLDGIEFDEDTSEADPESPELMEIHDMFQGIRDSVQRDCQAVQALLHDRIRHLSDLMRREYENLLQRASPELLAELALSQPSRSVAAVPPTAPPVRQPRVPTTLASANEVQFGVDLRSSSETELDDYL
jgi:hypothetical protein